MIAAWLLQSLSYTKYPISCCSLEKMIAALLSMIRETEVWDTMPSVIQLTENIMGSIVKVTQAENGMNNTVLLLSYKCGAARTRCVHLETRLLNI